MQAAAPMLAGSNSVATDTGHKRNVHAWYERALESELSCCDIRIASRDARRGDSSCRHNRRNSSGHLYLIGAEGSVLTGPTLGESTSVRGGDLVLALSDVPHVFVAAPLAAAALESVYATGTMRAEFHFQLSDASPLRRILPELVIVRATEASPQLRTLTTLLTDAACESRFGHHLVINKIAGSVLALALCEHIARIQTLPRILASKDARIECVLHMIHDQLGRNWSIHSLAAIAGMSRSTFVSRFLTVVGTPPMRYVASLKAALARQLLSDQDMSVAQVAERLGYSSEAAFRKMFKRVLGVGPGKIRNARRRWLHTSDVATHV